LAIGIGHDVSRYYNKAIKIAHKHDWQAHSDAFDDLETLIVTLGKDK